MCGIAGFAAQTPLSTDDLEALGRATAAMKHRGPDGSGEYHSEDGLPASSGRVALAMRRLSIIDLAGGWQPLKNEDESIALVANGEIYNHVELRAELKARGHRLRTGSDCETMIHLYEDEGLDFVHRLRGMFAFALWDGPRRRLVLGRDRLGEKPLYFSFIDSRKLVFASEMRALLATGSVSTALDPVSVHDYLHYGWVPEPKTMLSSVRKLPPGHLLVIDAERWSWQERCYWRIEDAPKITDSPVERLRAELDEIGKLIVRADVPVGIALSGGFDSSLTAAIAASHSAAPLKAFTVGYEGSPGQDERSMAQAFAADLGLPFHPIEVRVADMVDSLPRLAPLRDDPIADISGHGYYVLSQQAREHGCPVLLQGQGTDELFWGYPWAAQAVAQNVRRMAGHPVGVLETLWANRPRGLSRPQLVRLTYFLGGILAGWRSLTPALSASGLLAAYDLNDSFQIGAHGTAPTYTRRFADRVAESNHRAADQFRPRSNDAPTDIQAIAALCRGYLLQNGIAQGDRLSMANSVELRLPLVDYRLVELAVGIQKHTPCHAQQPKQLLREAARDLLPSYVMNRPKRGFTPPVAQWLGALRDRYGSELVSGTLVGADLLDPRAAARLVRSRWRFGTANDLFFKYLNLEFWYRGMQSAAAV
jgi:asparagine synthase (glutamine-hydrolysing)